MTAREAVELCGLAAAAHRRSPCTTRAGRTSGRAATAIERELAEAPAEVRESVRWLPIGEAVTLTV